MLEPVLANFKAYAAPVMTLRYVPNYFDILLMYLAILAMVPLVMALERSAGSQQCSHTACWLAAQSGLLSLTADLSTGAHGSSIRSDGKRLSRALLSHAGGSRCRRGIRDWPRSRLLRAACVSGFPPE